MTEETKSTEKADKIAADTDTDTTIPGGTGNKSFWMGIGIGSAALVAALMYAKRPRGKRRT